MKYGAIPSGRTTSKTLMVGSARRETQRAHHIVSAGECDGGGIGEDDGSEIKGKLAKGTMLEKYGSLELRISGSREELREFWIPGILNLWRLYK